MKPIPKSDLITRIRNGYMGRLDYIHYSYSKSNVALLRILQNEGIISSYTESEILEEDAHYKTNKGRTLGLGYIFLRYINKVPPFDEIKIHRTKESSMNLSELETYCQRDNFRSLMILTTNKGYLTHHEALQLRVGGQVICTIN